MKVLTNDTIACTCINKKWVSCIEFYCLILSMVCVFCLSLSIYNLKNLIAILDALLDIRLENSSFFVVNFPMTVQLVVCGFAHANSCLSALFAS